MTDRLSASTPLTQIVRPVEPQPHPITEAMRDIPGENRWWAATVREDEFGTVYENPGSDYQEDWINPYPVGSVLCGREVVSVEVRCVDGVWCWVWERK